MIVSSRTSTLAGLTAAPRTFQGATAPLPTAATVVARPPQLASVPGPPTYSPPIVVDYAPGYGPSGPIHQGVGDGGVTFSPPGTSIDPGYLGPQSIPVAQFGDPSTPGPSPSSAPPASSSSPLLLGVIVIGLYLLFR